VSQLHLFLNDERFRKEERLTRRSQFLRTQRRGCRQVTRCLVVYACKTEEAHSRVGLTVSRKVGGSVVRNLVKRRLREVFRRNKPRLPIGYDLVWIARKGAGDASLEELLEQAQEASNRAARKFRRRSAGGER
jgi:ribonuclease P protein component